MGKDCSRFSALSLGLAIGLVWGLGILITGLGAHFFPTWGGAFVTAMGSIYVGFKATVLGSLLGGLMGFIDGFIFGALVAWIYNCCINCCNKSCS